MGQFGVLCAALLKQFGLSKIGVDHGTPKYCPLKGGNLADHVIGRWAFFKPSHARDLVFQLQRAFGSEGYRIGFDGKIHLQTGSINSSSRS